MQFIPETTIDAIVAELERLENYDDLISKLEATQPAILGYLLSDNFKLFTNEERDYTLFLTLVIWLSIDKHYSDLTEISEVKISEYEEKNWDVFDQQKTKDFREKLTPFFEKYPQEDLLAFVEDSLEPDDDNIILPESRAYLFISMKSIIDAMEDGLM